MCSTQQVVSLCSHLIDLCFPRYVGITKSLPIETAKSTKFFVLWMLQIIPTTTMITYENVYINWVKYC